MDGGVLKQQHTLKRYTHALTRILKIAYPPRTQNQCRSISRQTPSTAGLGSSHYINCHSGITKRLSLELAAGSQVITDVLGGGIRFQP